MNLFLANIGKAFLNTILNIGKVSMFTFTVLTHCIRPPFYFKQIWRQILQIGYFSMPVVGLTAIFTGMVLALQSYTGFARFNAESAIATVVVLSITRELGPVLAGLMVGSLFLSSKK